jgi:hypothetical protein
VKSKIELQNRRSFASLPSRPWRATGNAGLNSVLSKNQSACICAYLHAIACKYVHSQFSTKNMCEVSPSAQLSAAHDMNRNPKSKIANQKCGGRPTFEVSFAPFTTLCANHSASCVASPGSGTETAPFLHHFSGPKNMNSRIANHLRISPSSPGAISRRRGGLREFDSIANPKPRVGRCVPQRCVSTNRRSQFKNRRCTGRHQIRHPPRSITGLRKRCSSRKSLCTDCAPATQSEIANPKSEIGSGPCPFASLCSIPATLLARFLSVP